MAARQMLRCHLRFPPTFVRHYSLDHKPPSKSEKKTIQQMTKLLFIYLFITSSLAWGYPISDNTVFHGCPGVKQNTSKS